MAADLAEMGSLLSKNKSFKYLLCAIDVYSKYAWINSIQDRGGGGVQKGPLIPVFPPVTSTKEGTSSQNFGTFSFDPFATLV